LSARATSLRIASSWLRRCNAWLLLSRSLMAAPGGAAMNCH
jgi:hypothetical protein